MGLMPALLLPANQVTANGDVCHHRDMTYRGVVSFFGPPVVAR
jgi:hypothetical protein